MFEEQKKAKEEQDKHNAEIIKTFEEQNKVSFLFDINLVTVEQHRMILIYIYMYIYERGMLTI